MSVIRSIAHAVLPACVRRTITNAVGDPPQAGRAMAHDDDRTRWDFRLDALRDLSPEELARLGWISTIRIYRGRAISAVFNLNALEFLEYCGSDDECPTFAVRLRDDKHLIFLRRADTQFHSSAFEALARCEYLDTQMDRVVKGNIRRDELANDPPKPFRQRRRRD